MIPTRNMHNVDKENRITISVKGENTISAFFTAIPEPAQISMAKIMAIYGIIFFIL